MGLFSNTGNIIAQAADPGSSAGAGALWSDTDANITSRRNDANSAWLQIHPSDSIVDGTIVDADVNASAAIALSKIATITKRLIVTSTMDETANVNKRFHPFGNTNLDQSAASSVDNPISATTELTLIRLVINVQTNGNSSGTNPVTFVDDGADAASVDTGTTTGSKDSGAISATIAADSKCCFSYDATTAALVRQYIIAELTD